jgi:hypothetical protein
MAWDDHVDFARLGIFYSVDLDTGALELWMNRASAGVATNNLSVL